MQLFRALRVALKGYETLRRSLNSSKTLKYLPTELSVEVHFYKYNNK